MSYQLTGFVRGLGRRWRLGRFDDESHVRNTLRTQLKLFGVAMGRAHKCRISWRKVTLVCCITASPRASRNRLSSVNATLGAVASPRFCIGGECVPSICHTNVKGRLPRPARASTAEEAMCLSHTPARKIDQSKTSGLLRCRTVQQKSAMSHWRWKPRPPHLTQAVEFEALETFSYCQGGSWRKPSPSSRSSAMTLEASGARLRQEKGRSLLEAPATFPCRLSRADSEQVQEGSPQTQHHTGRTLQVKALPRK